MAFGRNTWAYGARSLAIGKGSVTRGSQSIATGENTIAIANQSMAGGSTSETNGNNSIAWGYHAYTGLKDSEGNVVKNNTLTGGDLTDAGSYSTAFGKNVIANGVGSHAFGIGTIALGEGQTVVGKYNEPNTDALFIVGSGSNKDDKKNIFMIDKEANIILGHDDFGNRSITCEG
jgi:hypothetical protein